MKEKLQVYLLGKHFTIMTDHKPLSMCNNPKAQAPFCIERIRLKLQEFCYTVEHIHGASNSSDYLTQHSISAIEEDTRQTKDLKAYVNYIFESPVNEAAISLDDLNVLNNGRVALKLKQSY